MTEHRSTGRELTEHEVHDLEVHVLVARLLAAAPASVEVRLIGEDAPAGAPRSYLGDDRQVLWMPAGRPRGVRRAIDAELGHRPVPPALARRFGVSDAVTFWPRWTSVEVACKLADVPLPVWLRDRGLEPDAGLAIRTFRLAEVVMSCGVAPVMRRGTAQARSASRRASSIALVT